MLWQRQVTPSFTLTVDISLTIKALKEFPERKIDKLGLVGLRIRQNKVGFNTKTSHVKSLKRRKLLHTVFTYVLLPDMITI